MPWLDIRNRIEAANLLPAANVAWPNEAFAQPQDGSLWFAVEATGDTLEPLEMGGGTWREAGRLYAHIYTPAGAGSTDARQLAKAISDLFRAVRPPCEVIYHGGSIGVGEAADVEGQWWRLSVCIDFLWEDIQ